MKNYILELVSRNKDNKNVDGFKQRNELFFTDLDPDDEVLQRKFRNFVQDGVVGETSRMYYSINPRDTVKSNKELCKFLVDHPEYDLRKLKYKHISLAQLPKNADGKRWLFDFDIDDKSAVREFIKDIEAIDADIIVDIHKTPHGYAVITNRHFDTRSLLAKWADKDVTLKRDAMLCINWATKK